MKLTKKQTKALDILKNFKSIPDAYKITESKIIMAPTIGKFIKEAVKSDNSIKKVTVKVDGITYTLEVYDDIHIMTRHLAENNSSLVLNPEDVQALNETLRSGGTLKQAAKDLAYSIDSVEGRFGL